MAEWEEVGRVWNILEEDPTAFSDELEVENNKRKRVKNNLGGFGLSTRKEGWKEKNSGEHINESRIPVSKEVSQISENNSSQTTTWHH